MRKLVLCINLFAAVLSYAEIYADTENESVLNRYLVPAKITQLDWILLEITALHFSDEETWDDYAVVSFSRIFIEKEKPVVGIVFSVNKGKYLTFKKDLIENIFNGAARKAFQILKKKLPGIHIEKDIYAQFMTSEDKPKEIAVFVEGKIYFINNKQ